MFVPFLFFLWLFGFDVPPTDTHPSDILVSGRRR